ncbi:uncharacterized protein BJ171DRAFT_504634 [Polychytrium aggregatum]|uniref:uncharacterized protein n=1 Tax=Polychytrium aggregatum TaxID=110093 RepID=UPI0022FE415A|nr:uncharacterized protein BJ171DRAFT_504634 [Polychytrium aggregatum]KAI9204557.1 hypothetical protein BJ171DRAFT_504634 [Polychytrium aggregatum]
MTQSAFLWIRLNHGQPVEINVHECRNVYHLVKLIKSEFSPDLDLVALHRIKLFHCNGETELRPDFSVQTLVSMCQHKTMINSYEQPLIVTVSAPSALSGGSEEAPAQGVPLAPAERSVQSARSITSRQDDPLDDILPSRSSIRAAGVDVSQPPIVIIDLHTAQGTRPFKTLSLLLKGGRIQLRSLKTQHGFLDVYWIVGDSSEVLLQVDDDGYTCNEWVAGARYSFRVVRSTAVDLEIPYIETKTDAVLQDFGIVLSEKEWQPVHMPKAAVPSALLDVLHAYATCHTIRLESIRRLIISLFLLCACKAVNDKIPASPVCFDEGTPLEATLRVVRESAVKIVRYSGRIDYAVGKSRPEQQAPESAFLLVDEISREKSLGSSLPRTLAEGATSLLFHHSALSQQQQRRPFVFVLRTDGKKWIFTRMGCQGSSIVVEHSRPLRLEIREHHVDQDQVGAIYSWIHFLISYGQQAPSSKADLSHSRDDLESPLDCLSLKFGSMSLGGM